MCQRAKLQFKSARRKIETEGEIRPKEFGDLVTADHFIAQDDFEKGFKGEKTGFVVFDRGSKWLDCFPLPDKSGSESRRALSDFEGSTKLVKEFYSDCSKELINAAKELDWIHPTATPGRPTSTGVAERYVRVVVEGGSAALEQAGFEPKYWPIAAKHHCFSRNIEAHVPSEESDGPKQSPWERRHKQGPFKGLKIPFGALIDFKPTPVGVQTLKKTTEGDVKDKPERLDPKFSPKAVPGVFLGYFVLPGGRWRGDYLAARLEDFQDPKRKTFQIQRIKEF